MKDNIMKNEMVLVPRKLVDGLMDAASSVTYQSEEDEIGQYNCCGQLSYMGHLENCVYKKMKELLEREANLNTNPTISTSKT